MNPAPDPLAALVSAIATCDSAFRLMEVLLQFCRDQAEAYREWDDDLTGKANLPALCQQAQDVIAGFGGTVFTAEDSPEHIAAIRDATSAFVQQSPPPPVVRACVLLSALDRELTPKLRAMYPDYHPDPLAPDQLFPVYWPNLKANGWFPKSKLCAAPSSLAQPPEFLPHWGLAPSAEVFSGRRVEFVFTTRMDVKRPIHGPLKLGVGVLNASTTELTWDKVPEPPPARFHSVRPLPETRDAQIAAMRRVASAASTAGVHVLVFPELCLDRVGAEELFKHVEGLDPRPELVVLGSFHWQDESNRRNTAQAFCSGTTELLSHHKMTRFSYRDPDDRVTYTEDIRPGDTLHVFVSTDWSLVLLICRDFLDQSIGTLVERLRPTFLCIPSFTDPSNAFIDAVGALTARAQSVAVFANGPIPSDRVVGAFGVPRTREVPSDGVSLVRQAIAPETLPSLPCLFVYDSEVDQITHLQCGLHNTIVDKPNV